MFAARNQLLVPKHTGGAGPLFDAISGDYISSVTSGTAVNLTITAAAGADIFLDISDSANITYTNVKANGVSMTSLLKVAHNATANDGSLSRYRLAGAGTGSAITVTFTPGANGVANAVAYSYTGVTSCASSSGNPGVVGTTTSYTTPTLTWSSGINVCCSSWGPTFSSVASHSATSGTQKYFSTTSTAAGLYIVEATANATLSIGLFAGNAWAWALSTLT